jgi:hypothetical protein
VVGRNFVLRVLSEGFELLRSYPKNSGGIVC